jgi:hypothetical protein
MQHKPRYKLMRRILFPYSGEEPLSLKQSLRVVLAWILFFPLCMSLLTLVITVFGSYTPQRMVEFVIFTFLSGVFIFGLLGLLIVTMSNKAARFRQTWKAQKDQQ